MAVGAVLAAPESPQQETAPGAVFRVQVDAIAIDVVVADSAGNPVKGLTADHFEILEDGVRQDVTSFQEVDVPVESADRPLFTSGAIEQDVRTNAGPEGRVYLFALDQVPGEQALRTRQFLRRFVERYMADNDVAAVVFLGQANSRKSQDFTSNRRLLLQAIDSFSGGFPREATSASLASPPGRPSTNIEALVQVRTLMSHLRKLTESMAQIKGRRKSFLFISTGFPVDMFRILDYRGGSLTIEEEDAHRVVTTATRNNVTFYTIDPRGLTPDGGTDGETPLTDDPLAGPPPARSLRTLAEATGGFGLVNSNSFDQAFSRIVRDNSSYYILGFSSSNERRDGRFRKVQVRVTQPGLVVRARAGYVAPLRHQAEPVRAASKSPLAESTLDALGSPIGVSGLPIRVFAAPFKSAKKAATVALVIEVAPAGLELHQEGEEFVGTLEIGFVSTDTSSYVHPGESYITRLRLKPDTHARVQRRGLRVLSETTLPPGTYQLRVAAGNRSRKAGSVIYDLEVPDFSKAPLVMSGVGISSADSSQVTTVGTRNPLAKLLPGPVTAIRDFPAGDRLTLFTEVYDNQSSRDARTVELRAELRAEGGRPMKSTTQQRSSSELGGRPGGYGFTPELSLDGVTPGLYVIHVEAQSNSGKRPTASRDIQIRVH